LNIFPDLTEDIEMNLVPDNPQASLVKHLIINFSKVSNSLYLNFRLKINLTGE